MRIKIFERLLNLDFLFKHIKKKLENEYLISNKSQMFKDSFLIIVKITDIYFFVIRGSIDNSKERTITSFLALDMRQTMKVLELKKSQTSIENYLYNLIINNIKENSLNPLNEISISSLAKYRYNKKLLALERKVLNQIIPIIYNEFRYKDDLKKYPFSIFNFDKTLTFWIKVYRDYLNKIENKIIESSKNPIKIYKYYDFALPKELFQRVFDMVIIKNGLVDNSLKSIKWIVFMYTHKKLKPMRLFQVLKLIEEIGKYSRLLNKQNQKIKTEIKPIIIFISNQGYEKNIGKYLRENLNHDFKKVFPMFIVPPVNNDIWHNFRIDDELNHEEEQAKKRAKRFIKINNNNSKLFNYMKQDIQDARDYYNEIIEKKNKVKENLAFVNKWANFLNIENSNNILNLISNENRFEKYIKMMNNKYV